MRKILKISFAAVILNALATTPAFAQGAAQAAVQAVETDSGDTAWMLTASAFVLMTVIPGLAMFFCGQVRAKNLLSVLMQIGAITAITSVLWIFIGYSIAFSTEGNSYVGTTQNFMFNDMLAVRDEQSIGELVFGLFQMTLAIITPALIVGAWAQRARFGWVVAFSALWSLLVYAPVARWIWGNGILESWGVVDHAGGIAVLTSAGVSALVIAVMMGRGTDFSTAQAAKHNPALILAGAGLLWIGWFGLSGGSALAANDLGAASAIINTHLAASMAALIWMLIERVTLGRATAAGFAMGAVAGLSAIAPAAGVVGPGGATLIGIAAGAVCFYMTGIIKNTLKIDDTANVFALFGIGGMLGSLLLAIFASETLGGMGYVEGYGMGSQLLIQLSGIAVVAVYSAVVTVIIGYAISMVLPMRVSQEAEQTGLDISSHGE